MDQYGLLLSSAPISEPVTLAEAKKHCRIDNDITEEDDLIASLITAARELCEKQVNQAIVTQTWELALDRFPRGACYIRMPLPPLQSIGEITYFDVLGDSQTLAEDIDYRVDIHSRPGRIIPIDIWPEVEWRRGNAVIITFTAGVAAASVPEVFRLAIKLTVGHWYENREAMMGGGGGRSSAELPFGVAALLSSQWHGTY